MSSVLLLPSDVALREEMETLLSEADVSAMTLKSIRRHLEEKFSCDLSEKKEILKSFLAELMAGDASEEEDDDVAESAGASDGKKTKRANGFTKPVQLSTNLSEFLGVVTCPRTEVTKLIWSYIKENNLQNPNDKRQILCDEKLKKVFDGKDKLGMFKMTKYLSNMMKPVQDLVDNATIKTEPVYSSNKRKSPASMIDSDTEGVKSSGANSSSKKKLKKEEVKKGDAKSTSKEKSQKKPIKMDKDSDSVKPKTGYNKDCRLSAELAQVIGCPEVISRPAVVKKMWEYIRDHDLQNPADKREILLDTALKRVFKDLNSFTMFSMNKYLTEHITAL